jgi:uncharacterized protein (DUF1697 family)
MEYVALLRGINVGGNRKVEMKRLKALFESLGCTNVSTYINSGNVIFDSSRKQRAMSEEIASALKKGFGFEVGVLVKTGKQMQSIQERFPPHGRTILSRRRTWPICSME